MAGVRILAVMALAGWIQLTWGIETNVAEKKPAWMSSVWRSYQPASTAVDGVILAHDYKYSAVTKPYTNTPAWWKVDLQTQSQSASVTLYFNTFYKFRRNGVQLYISMINSSDPKEGTLCHSVKGRPNGTDIPDVLNVTCPGTWRYLTGYTETDNDGYGVVLDFVEVQVWICNPGMYGVNCTAFCNCLNSTCDRLTGFCSGDCRPGWQGQRCDTACNNTHYGTNCNKTCAERRCATADTSCDPRSGACDTGCLPGWIDEDCTQECVNKTYGANCTSLCSDRHCAGNSSCDHVTGTCDFTCESGWTGVDCKEECDSKHYGAKCLGACSSRHCVGNSSCNSTGTCDSGCEAGWTQADCTECDSKHYGPKCLGACSSRHCVGNSSCNSTGACDSGCETGWTLADCTDLIQGPSQQSDGTSFPIPAVVGAVVGVVVVLMVVIVVILIRRRRGEKHGRSAHEPVIAEKLKPRQVEDTGMYMNVGFDKAEKSALTSKKTSGKPVTVRSQNKSQSDFAGDAEYTTVSKDIGKDGTDDLDLERVEVEEDYDVSAQPVQVEDTPDVPDRNYYNLDDAGLGHVIPVSQLQARVDEMTLARAEEEFKRLPDGFVYSYDESQHPGNKGKNRFRGYYPYNYNRVVLRDVSDDKDTDYINASYLDGYKTEKRYIAAQGPYRPEVVVDFWRMIYQEECSTVVMVTGLVEGGKMKCLQYWPEQGTLTYGDIAVTKETETQLVNYTVTQLSAQNKKEGKIHHVDHFHFTSWPDHGVPDTSALLEFMWRVKVITRHQTQPVIVHCSAGIGRTGTYIAIESLVDQAAAEGTVDVVSFVSNMRGQRKNMIQTKEKYLFLYQAVAIAVSEGDTSLDADVIRQIDLTHVSGVTMGNKSAQEHLEALENESDRGLTGDLNTTAASYTSSKGFFLITSHLDKEEVWNQVYNNDSRTLITWASDQLINLPSTDRPVSTSRLTASMQTSKVISNDVILNTIDLTVNGVDVTTPIQHYHLTGSTRDPSVTLLIDSLLTSTSDQQRGSCTIVSQSVSEARLLVLLMNIASRQKDDGRVDVISNMRRLQSSLGGPPFSQDDVRRCLEFAQRRLESRGLYANF
ncbi:uncharacterized protein LOC124120826 isoform X2 [Haliotis rufescens]|uniref:uncharacterized protein LOC124120826 isoform X2 n=1 Tax=Haliotis rufescens TaxID=6454 RepID=UPI00201EDAED|nr:uncharacterized protein LOC124120826 isoform X2 [Haliotis rufescens]